ncbi:MAG: DUF3810 domain-containing protein [Phocaeicola sp.]
MKKILWSCIKWLPLVLLFAFVIACRYLPYWADAYMYYLYPTLSAFLSGIASLIPYSLEEVLIVGVVLLLLIYPIVARFRRGEKHTVWRIIKNSLLRVAWIYIWFYLGWGMSYYRSSIYERMKVDKTAYSRDHFLHYLDSYVRNLNLSYTDQVEFDSEELEQEVKSLYSQVKKSYGLSTPQSYQHPKELLFNRLYSSVGVLGYVGPFFIEMQLNEELLAIQYPFSYAHEYAHMLGVSSEAEANYWAFQVCSRSVRKEIRYSAYFNLLPYVLNNASNLLPRDSFNSLLATIRPEVLEEMRAKTTYWSNRYSPLVGEVQSWLYNQFLKGNKISSGSKNYGEVIELLIDFQEYVPFN